MKTIELSLARIGNSRGIRLPAELIRTISKTRLSARVGSLSKAENTALRELLAEMYGAP